MATHAAVLINLSACVRQQSPTAWPRSEFVINIPADHCDHGPNTATPTDVLTLPTPEARRRTSNPSTSRAAVTTSLLTASNRFVVRSSTRTDTSVRDTVASPKTQFRSVLARCFRAIPCYMDVARSFIILSCTNGRSGSSLSGPDVSSGVAVHCPIARPKSVRT